LAKCSRCCELRSITRTAISSSTATSNCRRTS
jgi:hypothetical protein